MEKECRNCYYKTNSGVEFPCKECVLHPSHKEYWLINKKLCPHCGKEVK